MPSFLNKVFGRKKDDKPGTPTAPASKRHSNASLLEGKYEAVSPTVSPSATKFSEAAQQLRDKDNAPSNPLSLFRSRSRTLPEQPRSSNAASMSAPHLTLNLPVPKEEKTRALGVVFEADPDNISTLPEAVIGERRLNPLETLLLVKACADHIVSHGGLETLGLMHPHWYAASPDVQRKLISLYIHSLDTKKLSPVTTLSPTPTAPTTVFSTELEYTRSPHDVAAVLRDPSFGSASSAKSAWAWYVDFATREREGGYDPKAFSQILVPHLPPAHLQLLTATLDIISSLAAHAEVTGASGSKLAKLFGLWLVALPRSNSNEDWEEFYVRWEQAGRILEHLFLAHIREEALTNKIPLRLVELVKQYPYSSQPGPSNDRGLPLLPRSRFSTRQYDALFVRITTELPSPNSKRPAREHPSRLISEALKATVSPKATLAQEPSRVWEDIKNHTTEGALLEDTYPELSRILDDETLRLLSLIPAELLDKSTSLSSAASPHRRSSSLDAATGNGNASKNGNGGHARDSTAPAAFMNWNDFSVVGFGDSLLTNDFAATLETEVEVTTPPPSSWGATKKRPGRSRSSTVDASTPRPAEKRGREGAPDETPRKAALTRVDIVPVDEAFIDFWSDALLDPISASWPASVVCQLRPGAFRVSLLVIEHQYLAPKPPAAPTPTAASPQLAPPDRRAASPRPSLSSNVSARKSFTFSPTKKRFSLFSTHNDSSARSVSAPRKNSRPTGRSPRIGEMGEILPEESVRKESAPPVPAIPPLPIITAPPADTPAPAYTEPVKVQDAAKDKPLVDLPKEVSAPADTTTPAEKALPPAPEHEHFTVPTPSPPVALDSSKPAAPADAPASADATDAQAQVDGAKALPDIVVPSKIAESAPADPTPESSDAPADAPIAPAQSGSHADSQDAGTAAAAQNEAPRASEKPGSTATAEAATEAVTEPSTSTSTSTSTSQNGAANTVHSAEPQTESQEKDVEPETQESVPAAQNGAAAHAGSIPSPSNSDDTVVGSEPGPVVDERAEEPLPQAETAIDGAPATNASENTEQSQLPAPAEAEPEVDASPSADNSHTE